MSISLCLALVCATVSGLVKHQDSDIVSRNSSVDVEQKNGTVPAASVPKPSLANNKGPEINLATGVPKVFLANNKGHENNLVLTQQNGDVMAMEFPVQEGRATSIAFFRTYGGQKIPLSVLHHAIMAAACCILSGVVWLFFLMDSKHAMRKVKETELNGEFRPITLFHCCSSRTSNIVETVFCHPCLWASTAAKTQYMSFATAIIIQGLLIILMPVTYGVAAVLLCLLRVHLRRNLSISHAQGTAIAWDCLYHAFCSMCATEQEYAFLEVQGDMEPCPPVDEDAGDGTTQSGGEPLM